MTEVGNLTQRTINEDSGAAVTSSILRPPPGPSADGPHQGLSSRGLHVRRPDPGPHRAGDRVGERGIGVLVQRGMAGAGRRGTLQHRNE